LGTPRTSAMRYSSSPEQACGFP